MSYGTVVKELARSLEDHIIAYDNLPNHGGCILYIDGPIRRIDIEIGALNQGVAALATFVREVLASTRGTVARIGVGIREGSLAVI